MEKGELSELLPSLSLRTPVFLLLNLTFQGQCVQPDTPGSEEGSSALINRAHLTSYPMSLVIGHNAKCDLK